MYVRWKSRVSTVWFSWGPKTLYAVLAENKRVNGKPRESFVKHLGCIYEHFARGEDPILPKAQFWSQVSKSLDALPLDAQTRASIEQNLSAKIYRPTPAEETEAREEQEHEALGETLRAIMGEL